MPAPIFEMDKVHFAYPSSTNALFSDFKLSLARRTSLSILGPSGAGKSSLLKLIFGVMRPTQGIVTLRAKNPLYLGQEETLIPWKSVIYNLLLPYRLTGKRITKTLISEARILLNQVGLLAYEKKRVSTLSMGMRKRVELARCLLKKPDLLLMDEPFASLDPASREGMILLCKKIEKKYGFASIFITHNIEDGVFFGQRVLVLGSNAQNKVLYEFENFLPENKDHFYLNERDLKVCENIRQKFFESEKTEPTEPAATIPCTGKSPRRWLSRLWPVATLLCFISVILLAKVLLQWPDYLLPWPSQVWQTFRETLGNGSIFHIVFQTVSISLSSFFIAMALTLPIGFGLAHSAVLRRVIMPIIVLFNTIPVIALAPFLLLWMGISAWTKIVVTVMVILFPLLLSTEHAFAVALRQTQLHRAYLTGKKFFLFVYLEWPYALPTLLSGWKTALSTSIIGTVISEFIMGTQGLGALISLAKSRFDTPLMFVGLIWLIIIGLLYFHVASLIQRLFTRTSH